jgi:hypothetical protein
VMLSELGRLIAEGLIGTPEDSAER